MWNRGISYQHVVLFSSMMLQYIYLIRGFLLQPPRRQRKHKSIVDVNLFEYFDQPELDLIQLYIYIKDLLVHLFIYPLYSTLWLFT